MSLVTRRAFFGPPKSIRAAEGDIGRMAGGEVVCELNAVSTTGIGFRAVGLVRRGGLGLELGRPSSSRRGEVARFSGERTASKS